MLQPEAVVAAASGKESPLHSHFTWDDTEAARQHRLHQARQLIRVQVSVLPTTSTESRVFVSLTGDRRSDGGYRPIVDVLSSEELYKRLLSDATAEAERFAAKFEGVKEMAGVISAIKKLKARRKAA